MDGGPFIEFCKDINNLINTMTMKEKIQASTLHSKVGRTYALNPIDGKKKRSTEHSMLGMLPRETVPIFTE